jgi:hypothetical protein
MLKTQGHTSPRTPRERSRRRSRRRRITGSSSRLQRRAFFLAFVSHS